jgi:hypothetical protein
LQLHPAFPPLGLQLLDHLADSSQLVRTDEKLK